MNSWGTNIKEPPVLWRDKMTMTYMRGWALWGWPGWSSTWRGTTPHHHSRACLVLGRANPWGGSEKGIEPITQARGYGRIKAEKTLESHRKVRTCAQGKSKATERPSVGFVAKIKPERSGQPQAEYTGLWGELSRSMLKWRNSNKKCGSTALWWMLGALIRPAGAGSLSLFVLFK